MYTPERTASTALVALLLAAVAAGCSGPDEARSGAGADEEAGGGAGTATTAEQPRVPDAELGEIEREDLGLSLPWTTGRISREPPGNGRPSPLRRLAFSRLDGIDRLVFEFDSADAFPGYVLDASLGSMPGCEAGDSVTARGEGLLRIRFLNASADPEVAGDSVRRADLANVETVRRCARGDDTVEWLLDVRQATLYRVLRASNPPRLAVDVRHELARASRDP